MDARLLAVAVLVAIASELRAAASSWEQLLDSASLVEIDENEPWEMNFYTLGSRNGLPVGIIRRGSHFRRANLTDRQAHMLAGRPEKSVKLTLREVLENFSVENPQYEARVIGGTLMVLPRNLRKHPFNAFNRKISKFKTTAFSFSGAAFALFEREGVRLARKGESIECTRVGKPELADYSCEESTLLECLNTMAAPRTTFWQIANDGKGFYGTDGCGGIEGAFY